MDCLRLETDLSKKNQVPYPKQFRQIIGMLEYFILHSPIMFGLNMVISGQWVNKQENEFRAENEIAKNKLDVPGGGHRDGGRQGEEVSARQTNTQVRW